MTSVAIDVASNFTVAREVAPHKPWCTAHTVEALGDPNHPCSITVGSVVDIDNDPGDVEVWQSREAGEYLSDTHVFVNNIGYTPAAIRDLIAYLQCAVELAAPRTTDLGPGVLGRVQSAEVPVDLDQ